MTQRIIPAIMSGGSGTRLWPLSSDTRPKQFHAFDAGAALFTETARRLSGAHDGIAFAAPIILCNAAHTELIRDGLREAGVEGARLVLEPEGRNTAAAAAVAAALAAELDPEALVLLAPSDHVITDAPAFFAAVQRAAPFSAERIITFGETPDRPATGFGYIRRGAALGPGVFTIDQFREKPDQATAEKYLALGEYRWNTGMFLFSPRVLLAEFEANAAIRDQALKALSNAERRNDEIRLNAQDFARAPSLPLDIAVMERTTRGAVAPCEIGWSDVGAWDEIWRRAQKDEAGNAIQGEVVALECADNLLRGDGVEVRAAGVSGLIVIATREGVLITTRDRAQDVKHLRALAEQKR